MPWLVLVIKLSYAHAQKSSIRRPSTPTKSVAGAT
jgi:hypothetical protein